MTNEQDEKIKVNFAGYYAYFFKFYGGFIFLITSTMLMVCFMLCKLGADYIVGNWATQEDQQSKFWFYCGLSFAFAIG